MNDLEATRGRPSSDPGYLVETESGKWGVIRQGKGHHDPTDKIRGSTATTYSSF